MPIYKDKSTGQYLEYDDSGNFVKTYNSDDLVKKVRGPEATQPKSNIGPSASSTIEPSGFMRNHEGLIRNSLMMGGSLAGSVGGPLGSLAGGAAADILGQDLTTGKVNPGEALLYSGANEALGFGMGKASKFLTNRYLNVKHAGEDALAGDLKTRLFQKMFPIHRLPEDVEAINSFTDELQPTVGQATGSGLARFIEGGFAGGSKKVREQEQEQTLLNIIRNIATNYDKEANPFSPRSADATYPISGYAKQTQDIIKSARAGIKTQERNAWDKVRQFASDNLMTVKKVIGSEPSKIVGPDGKPVGMNYKTENVDIMGPIVMNKSEQVYKQEVGSINDFLSDETIKNLPSWVANKYKRVKQALDNVFSPTQIMDKSGKIQELNVKDFDSVKEFRTAVRKLIQGKSNLSNDERILVKLSDALDDDTVTSMSVWPKNGKTALLARTTAEDLTKERDRRFNNLIMKQAKGDPTRLFNKSFSNADEAAKLMDTVGSGEEAPIRAAYIQKLYKETFDEANMKFDPNKFINTIEANDSPARKILTQEQRSNLIRFARAYRPISEKDPMTGRVALWIRGGSIALGGIGGLLTSAFAGGDTSSKLEMTALGAATATIGIHQFAEKILLNPRYAKLATRALQVRGNSPEAKYIQKTLLAGMKGLQLELNIPVRGSMVTMPAVVNKDGKIQPQLNTGIHDENQ